MNDMQIRNLMLHHPVKVKYLRLSNQQRTLLYYISKHKSVNSGDIVNVYGITVQNAWNRLNRLHRQGYLSRRYGMNPTGGVMYTYYIADRINL